MFLASLFVGWLLFILLRFKPPRGQLNCGIFGFSGARPVDLTKLKWLAVENQSRGTDSTGIYGNHLFKEKGPARNIVLMPGFIAATKGAHTVQGHTRSASPGSNVNKENAHPFQFGHEEDNEGTKWKATVVGAHNGFIIPETLRHHEEEFGFKRVFPVDSQVIFAALAKTGDVKAISKIEGAMAVSFQMISHHPNRLYLYRRRETRPLYIGEASDGLYYSSLEDALKFIGCRTTWEVVGDLLYTLENGQIIDIYQMPLPTLKSLAANVTRGSWRQGLPFVEQDALPKSVTLPMKASASGNSAGYTSQLPFGNSRGFAHNPNTTAQRMAQEYKSPSSIDSKFNMLMRNLTDELVQMDAFPIDVPKPALRDDNHLASCALVINLVNQGNNKGLVAWSILADGEPSIAAITTGNGIAVLKIPPDKCEGPMTFFAYCPIEQYGPYKFVITPLAARVMEVTLSIPFLKKGSKKEAPARAEGEARSDKTGNEHGKAGCALYVSPSEQDKAHVDAEGNDRWVLSGFAAQVSWGIKKEYFDGVQEKLDPFEFIIPETDIAIGPGASLAEKIKNSVINRKPHDTKVLLDTVLETGPDNQYRNYPNMPVKITQWAITHPQRAILLQYYMQTPIYQQLRSSELILDASRLMQRDRFIIDAWYPFWTYIEVLLRNRFKDYVRLSATGEPKAVDFYPSTLLKKSLKKKKLLSTLKAAASQSAGTTFRVDKAIDFPQYCVYVAFLNHLIGVNSGKMTEESKKQLREYKRTLADNIMALNSLVLDDGNENLTQAQRKVIIDARNLMKLEYSDVITFLQDDDSPKGIETA